MCFRLKPEFGIIPARAGFTGTRWPTPSCTTDHPRSRGVYRSCPTPTAPPAGSSPLARGLHAEGLVDDRPVRIIPARAGFTPSASPSSRRRPDHPRSRGVYPPCSRRWCGPGGSSPLARGLLVDLGDVGQGGGIIPARAGFTDRQHPRRGRGRDHPRSRGVYIVQSAPPPTRTGSSPLARGLLHVRHERAFAAGIIPARAGFTTSGNGRTCSCRDHPRSRGVYPHP